MKTRRSGLTRSLFLSLAVLGPALLAAKVPFRVYLWTGFGGNAQHQGESLVASQSLTKVLWQTPVDTDPPYSGGELLIHYGEPSITTAGNVILPVRHGDSLPFTIECRNGKTGALVWSATTSFIMPSYDWIPSVGPTLVPGPPVSIAGSPAQVAWPESGGRVAIRANGDAPNSPVRIHAFYGDANYSANKAAMDANVKICTPITAGTDGNLYFGYYVEGTNPLHLQSGIAVLHPDGTGASVSASSLSADTTQPQYNSAPAISLDHAYLYATICDGYGGQGYLVKLNAATLAEVSKVLLLDPYANAPALVYSDSTASPMVGPDGTVYQGVLENSLGSNHYRGWMLHYSGDLATTLTPGEFGWDDTATVVPSNLVAGYTGSSSYLIFCKYNNYAGAGGDGVNKVAVLDPNATQRDPATGTTVMKEVVTLVGQTPDQGARNAGYPNAVKEWCVNSGAVDLPGAAILVASEDGVLYRWNLQTDSISDSMRMSGGLGEAYLGTEIGPTGIVYGTSNATLYAVGAG